MTAVLSQSYGMGIEPLSKPIAHFYIDEEKHRKISFMSLEQRMGEYLDFYETIYSQWCGIVQRQLQIEVIKPHEDTANELTAKETELVAKLKQTDLAPDQKVDLEVKLDKLQKALNKANGALKSKTDRFYQKVKTLAFRQSHADADRIWRIATRHSFSLEMDEDWAYVKTVGHATSYFQDEITMYGWSKSDSFHFLFLKPHACSEANECMFI